jgi:hypothetical protein
MSFSDSRFPKVKVLQVAGLGDFFLNFCSLYISQAFVCPLSVLKKFEILQHNLNSPIEILRNKTLLYDQHPKINVRL